MTTVIDQVKNAAYASVGVNLLVTDALVGHEVSTPEFAIEHASIARKQATDALTGLRARTEPRASKLEARFPEKVASALASSRTKAWTFVGIDAPAKPASGKTGTKKKTTGA